MRWKYFTVDEFACPCCGAVDIDYQFVDKLEKVRGRVSFPFDVRNGSGYRCAKHNKDVGGIPMSAHRYGRGVDIPVTGQQVYQLLALGLQNFGIFGVGISQTKESRFIHFDDMNHHEIAARPNIWTY